MHSSLLISDAYTIPTQANYESSPVDGSSDVAYPIIIQAVSPEGSAGTSGEWARALPISRVPAQYT
jgi:hypothetical protein